MKYELCLCGEPSEPSGLCSRCEDVKRSLEPDPDCPYCQIAQRFGKVVDCTCIAGKMI